MIRISDFRGVFQTAVLSLKVTRKAEEDVHVLDFSFPEGLDWQPGDHGLFTLQTGRGRKFRAFSVASVPSEGVIKVATRIPEVGASTFKQTLGAMEPGGRISVRGPFGWVKFRDQDSPVVMICGGVGITPFRAMLMGTNKTRDITLIYYNPHSSHLFRYELEEIAASNSKVRIFFLSEREEVRKSIDAACGECGKSTWYYLSGNPGAVKNWKRVLRKGKVSARRVMSDAFFGYREMW